MSHWQYLERREVSLSSKGEDKRHIAYLSTLICPRLTGYTIMNKIRLKAKACHVTFLVVAVSKLRHIIFSVL
jgi:hypothetical protein